ncbi:Phytanoyl-CoA dioxygenase [Crinalium epipsammum PCC 9333]|uniref:Phytanoyl-CoA dioxygenase n=1 Tax=Crinalium epipsammum PCC 9333 TaxID=1173022 RepID=K9VWK6_9CYAN|nr:phytanoyl-CoA dioxygenase family protein [Crinalium epipsammum]AFZ12488.1 Phytanoyl-CoA dioxygenase [Crinalium epipsammum PCC 9333]
MELTQEQFNTYQKEGFLVVPEYFSQLEVENMKGELPALFAEDSPRRVLEKDGDTVRAVHGSHSTNQLFKRLTRHPKIVSPARQILGSQVYVYQFKINAKAAFSGDFWQWHQDFIFWRKQDGLLTPRIMNAMILLDDMNEFNGALFVIPGSHKEGMIDVTSPQLQEINNNLTGDKKQEWLLSFTANLKYSLPQEIVQELALKYGMYAIKAPAGSAVFFDSNIAHASPNNISPFSRSIVIVTYNSVENIPVPVENPRPEFIVSRDYLPVEALSGDALLLPSLI